MDNISAKRTIPFGGVTKYAFQNGKKLKRQRIALSVSGAAIGAVNGLFGAGGGMLVVPALSRIAKLSDKKAHATAIAVILPLCAVSTAVYFAKGSYDYSIFAPSIGGVIIGSVLGALALKKANNAILKLVFYGLMLLAGFKLLL